MSGVAPGTHFQRVACLAPGLCRRLPCSVFFLLPLLIALLLLTAAVLGLHALVLGLAAHSGLPAAVSPAPSPKR